MSIVIAMTGLISLVLFASPAGARQVALDATTFERIDSFDASVVERLAAAGAVLVAKLSLGALAYGDIWDGGVTRNPWNLFEGSSGSSAGPAARNEGTYRRLR